MADEQRPEEVQRCTAKRRAALVLSLLKGETPAAEAARQELNRFKRKVGELTIDLDILRTADRLRPMTPGTSDE
jgi:hypothetical protein